MQEAPVKKRERSLISLEKTLGKANGNRERTGGGSLTR